MKFFVNRQELLKKLLVLERVLPSKAYIAALDGVYIKLEGQSLTLMTNNLEMAIKTTLQVEAEGQGEIVLDKKLFPIVQQLSGDEVKIEVADESAVIKSGKSKFKLQGNDPEEFPEFITGYEDWTKVHFEGAELKNIIKKTSFCIAKEEGKITFTGILLQCSDNGLTCIGSDTFRLARYRKDFEAEAGFSMLMPGKLLIELGRILNDEQQVTVYAGNSQSVFVFEDYVASLRLLENNYPDITKAIPKESKTTVTANRQELLKLLSRADIVAKDAYNTANISVADNVLKVHAEGLTGKMKDEMSVTMENEEAEEVCFNIKFLQEGLKALDGKEIELQFNGSLGPCMMIEEGYEYLVLPIKKEG